MRRRIRHTRGFAMIDALVALAVAALTLSLLTSASWGLKIASDRRAAIEQTNAADWLLARRTLQGWAGDVSNAGPRAAGANLVGTASTVRMQVRGQDGFGSFVGELRVEGSADIGYTLSAARHDGLQDARLSSDAPRRSTLLRAQEPSRFVYLFMQSDGTGTVWRYETGDGGALPLSVAIEVGDTRRVTAPVHTTISQTCLSSLGQGGMEDRLCSVR
ncbi:MAG: hypothetical protein OXD48_12655 [Litoreibacter sp.]|nr:hypothetical protein [Litoreibacter sp.]